MLFCNLLQKAKNKKSCVTKDVLRFNKNEFSHNHFENGSVPRKTVFTTSKTPISRLHIGRILLIIWK